MKREEGEGSGVARFTRIWRECIPGERHGAEPQEGRDGRASGRR